MPDSTFTDRVVSETELSRRSLLRYVGFGAAVAATRGLGPLTDAAVRAAEVIAPRGWLRPDGSPAWQPVAYPLPLASDGGAAGADADRFKEFTVRDQLLLPDGYKAHPLAFWGDRFKSAGRPFHFGYAADYTGLAPVAGTKDEFWLIVNHEYISGRPWLQGWDAVQKERFGECPVTPDGKLADGSMLQGQSFDLLTEKGKSAVNPAVREQITRLCSAALSDLGLSVLRVRRRADGTFTPVADTDQHLRISALPEDNHHFFARDKSALTFTGPAAAMLGTPTGTFSNCSGETTPWGTFLTCEENVQDQVWEHLTPAGSPLQGGKKFTGMVEPGKEIGDPGAEPGQQLPFEFEGLGAGLATPLEGRQFGWVCEIFPGSDKRVLAKHTTLGRFRHENVSLRVEAGRKLVAYMGDDRRGGHLWKFVSEQLVEDPASADNSKLFEKGTLFVAKFTGDQTGRWIPLTPETPIAEPRPETTVDGVMMLPYRPDGGQILVGAPTARNAQTSVRRWKAGVEQFTGKPLAQSTLADLVTGENKQAVILMEAFLMANAAGGTPCARPEDVEVHPVDKSVYIAFSDTTGADEGSPDKAVFRYSDKGKDSRQYGAIYHLIEDGNDGAAATFKWSRFASAGEVGDEGTGFACADNLAFDAAANLWMVCDITTPTHNFPVTRNEADKSDPGAKNFLGVFGNNAMYMIPTRGPSAGVPHCFAIGPMECELTGPTFTKDGRTLILAIQHPGELYGTHADRKGQTARVERTIQIAGRDGKVIPQKRTVPFGSNYPGGKPGDVPRPGVVCIVKEA